MEITPENYLATYQVWTGEAKKIWANKNRPEADVDVWHHSMRNEMALEMIGNIAKGKKVLAVGVGPIWVDRDLLDGLGATEIVKSDIIDSGDIDLVADACELPVEDKTYDFIICRELIEHVLSPIQLLIEMRRVLKDDGYMLITTPNAYNVRPDGCWHLRAYSPGYFLVTLKHQGFKVVAKKGDVPGIHYGLLFYAKQGDNKRLLSEFKRIAKKVEKMKDSYYIGTHLTVLCRKN